MSLSESAGHTYIKAATVVYQLAWLTYVVLFLCLLLCFELQACV